MEGFWQLQLRAKECFVFSKKIPPCLSLCWGFSSSLLYTLPEAVSHITIISSKGNEINSSDKLLQQSYVGTRDYYYFFSALHQTVPGQGKGLKYLQEKWWWWGSEIPLLWDALYSHSQMGFLLLYQQFRFSFLKKEIICKQCSNRRQRMGFWVHKRKTSFRLWFPQQLFILSLMCLSLSSKTFHNIYINEVSCRWEIVKKLIFPGKRAHFYVYIHISTHTFIKKLALMSTFLFLLYIAPWNRQPALITWEWEW